MGCTGGSWGDCLAPPPVLPPPRPLTFTVPSPISSRPLSHPSHSLPRISTSHIHPAMPVSLANPFTTHASPKPPHPHPAPPSPTPATPPSYSSTTHRPTAHSPTPRPSVYPPSRTAESLTCTVHDDLFLRVAWHLGLCRASCIERGLGFGEIASTQPADCFLRRSRHEGWAEALDPGVWPGFSEPR